MCPFHDYTGNSYIKAKSNQEMKRILQSAASDAGTHDNTRVFNCQQIHTLWRTLLLEEQQRSEHTLLYLAMFQIYLKSFEKKKKEHSYFKTNIA